MAQEQKRDAQGRFVRTTPDWKSIAEAREKEINALNVRIIKYQTILTDIDELVTDKFLVRGKKVRDIIYQ